MRKNCIIIYSTCIKKTNNRYKSCMTNYKRVFVVSILVCLVFIVVFSSVVPSEAGTVYGRVFLDGGSFPPQDILTFLDAKGNSFTIKTEQNGNYNAFLPTGVYTVTFTQEGEEGKKETKWSAIFRSYPNPVKQNIYLKKQ